MAINTIATYGRSVFAMALSLFSSRWVLSSLGQSDFGLYNVVGSIIVFIVFLNSLMAGSASRFFAYSIGKGEAEDVNHWFNASLCIHLILSGFLIAAGWPLGELAIKHMLTVPENRLPASIVVFRISLVSAFFGMLSVPYIAMFTAKQRIAEIALFGGGQSLLFFALAYYIRTYSGDRLIVFAFGMMSIAAATQIAQIVRANAAFAECRISTNYFFSKWRMRAIFTFSGWAIIDSAGAMLRNQGSAVLLNVFFGTTLNAAFGVANQVSAQTSQLSGSLMNAFSPEITSNEGKGDRQRMLALADDASKFGTILMVLFAVPLVFEIDYVLKIWLHTPPDHTALFCRLMITTFLIDRITTGVLFAVNAKGDVAGYQMTVGLSQLLTLPLAWVFLKIGFPPGSVGIAFISTTVLITIGRLYWQKRLFGVDLKTWSYAVFRPITITAVLSIVFGAAMRFLFEESFSRLCLVCLASGSVTIISAYVFVLNKHQRKLIQNILLKVYGRLVNYSKHNSMHR